MIPPEASITFIVPAYNAEATISRTLRSLEAQSDPRWAAIVIDDGSSDGTVDVVRSCPSDRVLLVQQTNSGPSSARNAGWRRAGTPFVCFLDADDTIDDTFVETMLPLAEASSVGAICGFRFADSTGVEIARTPAPTAESMRMPGLLAMDPPAIMSVVHRQDSLARAAAGPNLFDPSLAVFEDWDLLRRIAAGREPDWRMCGETLVSYRCTPGSITTQTSRVIRAGLELIARHADDVGRRDGYVRRYRIASLAACVIAEDRETAHTLLADIGSLESDEHALLSATIRWHAQRRWAVADDRLVEYVGAALDLAHDTLGPETPLLDHVLAAIRGWAIDPWSDPLREAKTMAGSRGRVVLYGAGRNGIRAAATARALGIEWVIADDDAARSPTGMVCISADEIGPDDAVVLTPAESGGIERRLRAAGLTRIVRARSIDQAA